MNEERANQLIDAVGRAADGDPDAWNWIVAEFSNLLWSVVRPFRLGADASADAVQTTWLRLVENLGSIRDPRCLPAWLATTARNTCLATVTQGKRSCPMAEDYEPPSPGEPPEVTVLRADNASVVRIALGQLAERDRELLTVLVADPPIPYEEIGARLGMPVGSIGPTRMRALRRLRDQLERRGLVDAAVN